MIPLVLLPGMMCDGRLFGPQIAAFGGRTLHLAPMVGADTVQALAAQIIAQAPPRFALAGLSMGGIVAMEIMARAPERVTRLALLDTNPRAELPEVQAGREPQIACVTAGGLDAVMRDEMKPNYLTNGPHRAAILDLCMDMARGLGPKVFIDQSRALQSRPDQQATLARVTVPTLILCGRDDALCPVERHTFMHALIPHSTLHLVEGAGHLPTLEQPFETTAALARWLED
jgi:pimeloyl-ACP methyl ester carboxylesterase